MSSTIPWEERSSWFDLGAILGTIKAVILAPGETFEGMEESGDMIPALAFNALMGLVAGIISGAFSLFLQVGMQFLQADRFEALLAQLVGTVVGGFIGMLFGAFVGVIIGLATMIMLAGVVHGILYLLNAATRPFAETVKAMAYVQGGLVPISIVPILGLMILMFMNPIYQIIAISRVHRASTGHAAIAVLVPFLTLIGIAVVIAVSIVLIFGVALASLFK